MRACNWPDCPGTIDDMGFCDENGHLPLPDSPSRITGGSSASSATSWPRGDTPLVELPLFPAPKPHDVILADPAVPERNRFCQNRDCRVKVGRTSPDRTGLAEGYCWKCGTQFSFVPSLRPGRRVGDRYDVLGAIAHGGVGWVYLAQDIKLDRQVVLKGLINTADGAAVDAAIAERRYQTILDHANIVRPLDFVSDVDPASGDTLGYLVMEYVGGKSLRAVVRDARDGELVLPIEHIIGYGLEILKALGYVHRLGLLHCDVKPDNVVAGGGRVRLIDLGAMRKLTDTGTVWGDPDYQVHKDEIKERGLTVDSDLYSLGRTLAELLDASVDNPRRARRGDRLAGTVDSFVRITARAANPDWNRRFVSAADMTEQLTLVLWEVIAARGGRRVPLVSAQFAPEVELFDDGLAAVPPLARWADEPARRLARRSDALADGRPSPALIAGQLPDPLPDPEDPATPELATISTSDPKLLLDQLPRVHGSVEVELWRCRAHLALTDAAGARADLDAADRAASGDDRHRWRINWHRALVELATAADKLGVVAAAKQFDEVLASVPGEAAPKLALGYCAEYRGHAADAERHYEEVWGTDKTRVSAAFGLVRLKLAARDRRGAVAVLDEVPALSRHYDAARVAAVRVLVGRLGAEGLPDAADLDAAATRLAELDERRAGLSDADRDLLAVTVLQAAVGWAADGEDPPGSITWGPAALARFGSPVTRKGLPDKLSRALRRLARNATDRGQHDTLIDYANTVRPRTRS